MSADRTPRQPGYFCTDNEALDLYLDQLPGRIRAVAGYLYIVLARYARNSNQVRVALLPLANKVGCSKPTAIKAIDALVSIGLISKRYDGTMNIYELLPVEKSPQPESTALTMRVNSIDHESQSPLPSESTSFTVRVNGVDTLKDYKTKRLKTVKEVKLTTQEPTAAALDFNHPRIQEYQQRYPGETPNAEFYSALVNEFTDDDVLRKAWDKIDYEGWNVTKLETLRGQYRKHLPKTPQPQQEPSKLERTQQRIRDLEAMQAKTFDPNQRQEISTQLFNLKQFLARQERMAA